MMGLNVRRSSWVDVRMFLMQLLKALIFAESESLEETWGDDGMTSKMAIFSTNRQLQPLQNSLVMHFFFKKSFVRRLQVKDITVHVYIIICIHIYIYIDR